MSSTRRYKGKSVSDKEDGAVPQTDESTVSDNLVLSMLTTMQTTMNTILESVNDNQKRYDQLYQDIKGPEGINECLSEVQEASGKNSDSISKLEKENEQLRKEVQVLKGVVIHLAQKQDRTDAAVLDLQGRSMKPNILIHGYPETEEEKLYTDIPRKIDEKLGVKNIKFIEIHRIGSKEKKVIPGQEPRPRIIAAHLSDPGRKSEILDAAKELDDEEFRVTNQYPDEVRDRRSRLYAVKAKLEAKQPPTRSDLKYDKLVFKNGSIHREKVELPSAESLLSVSSDDKLLDKLKQIKLTKGEEYTEKRNFFVSHAAKTESLNAIKNFSTKVLYETGVNSATSNVLVYRYTDSKDEIHEGWINDHEFGAGQSILRMMKENGYMNCSVVMSRWLGDHLGYKRFNVFQNNAKSALSNL